MLTDSQSGLDNRVKSHVETPQKTSKIFVSVTNLGPSDTGVSTGIYTVINIGSGDLLMNICMFVDPHPLNLA